MHINHNALNISKLYYAMSPITRDYKWVSCGLWIFLEACSCIKTACEWKGCKCKVQGMPCLCVWAVTIAKIPFGKLVMIQMMKMMKINVWYVSSSLWTENVDIPVVCLVLRVPWNENALKCLYISRLSTPMHGFVSIMLMLL